jgi:hypothetical protein
MFPKLQVVIFVVCFTVVWLQLSFWLVLWLCFRVPLFEAIMMCQSGFQHIFDNVFFRVLCLRNIYSMDANGLNPIKSQNYRIILCIYINIYPMNIYIPLKSHLSLLLNHKTSISHPKAAEQQGAGHADGRGAWGAWGAWIHQSVPFCMTQNGWPQLKNSNKLWNHSHFENDINM